MKQKHQIKSLFVAWIASASVLADSTIIRDGTVGPDTSVQPLADANGLITIDENMGSRPGDGENLFHSFTTFNVGVTDTALFTANPNLSTQRVITRVTGELSRIDGTLASNIPGADLYFLNPRGILFGDSAKIDVQGSFFASTAETLVMLDDDPQGALTFSSDVRLAFAEPQAFGFLGQPVSLVVDGATLKVGDENSLSLTGGNVDILNGAKLRAPGGEVALGAVGDEQTLPINTNRWAPNTSGILNVQDASINASGSNKGRVQAIGADVRFTNSSISTDLANGSGGGGNSGSGSGGSGNNNGSGGGSNNTNSPSTAISLMADSTLLLDNTQLAVSTDANRRTGEITIAGADVTLDTGTALTTGPCEDCDGGAGGSLDITGSNSIRIINSAAGDGPILNVSTNSARNAGDINLAAPQVTADQATITTFTLGEGQAGSVSVNADVIELTNRVDLQSIAGVPSFGGGSNSGGGGTNNGGGNSGGGSGSGGGNSGGGNGGGSGGGGGGGGDNTSGDGGNVNLIATQRITTRQNVNIGANSNTTGNAGSVVIQAPVVEILQGSRIASAAADAGNGGSVSIIGVDRVELSGTNNPNNPERDRGSRITASSAFTASGDAGSITIEAGELILANGARVTSSTSGVGQGGAVTITATDSVELSGTRGDGRGTSIRAAAEIEEEELPDQPITRSGNAGEIFISTPSLSLGEGTEIRSTTGLPGSGGTIVLDVSELQLDNATIEANSVGAGSGQAGNISIGIGVDDAAIQYPLAQSTLTNNAVIATSADDAGGGNIVVNGNASLRLFNSGIDASDTGGEGGNVFVTANKDILVADNSRILARAAVSGGAGGVIELTTEAFVLGTNSIVSAENAVVINSPETNVEAQVAQLPEDFQDGASLFGPLCAARTSGARSGSFTLAQGMHSPPSPDIALIAFTQPELSSSIADLEAQLSLDLTNQIRADILQTLAEREQARGRFSSSIEHINLAIKINKNNNDQQRLAQNYNALGNAQIAADRGNAAESFAQALAKAPSPLVRAAILHSRGNLYSFARNYKDALADYRQASQLTGTNNLVNQDLISLASATRAAINLGDTILALQLANQMLELASSREVKTAKPFIHLAATLIDSHPAVAQRSLEQSQRIASTNDDQRNLAYIDGLMGSLNEAHGQYSDALRDTRSAILRAQRSASDSLYRWLYQEARILNRAGQSEAALSSYQSAIATLEAQHGSSPIRYGNVLDFRAEIAPLYQDTIATLLADSNHANLRTARTTFEKFKNAELRDYFHDDCVAALDATSVPLDSIAADTAIIYPILLSDRVELLISLNNKMSRYSSPIKKSDLVALTKQLRGSLENRTTREYLPFAQRLYDILIGPYIDDIERAGAKTLVFVPDGALHTAPMGALHDGKQFLAQRFAIAVTPSLTLFEPKPLDVKAAKVLLAGVSESRDGFNALPNVPDELDSIQKLMGGQIMLNESFETQQFGREIGDYQPNIVHIASHAVFSGDPASSYLLTYSGKVNMNQLHTLVAQSRFREPLELITLSACETAAGDDRAALGLSGTAIRAGARSALGTLWTVSDEASQAMLVSFYEALTTSTSKAAALRTAQQSLLNDARYSHPYYWAPYLMISNWL